ncbi:NAD-dependent epimerase/dehydratase family protein [Sphingobacterium hungaricum]|uniref:Epimerase n=1 Tax=Sphingobacterium hungaricum TaxID=2082723 RepID=A0A928YTE3_9SPHI|nr:NAD-dependent epimerase/dehydratase family protein [Sphingobacterium hungaricum]MBE8715093.1 epimerase [Sphingobacterium hungaricum]
MKVILTGASGYVGEGVLLSCLNNAKITEILMINRRHVAISHPKLKELVVSNFFNIEEYESIVSGYDACFYCAGVSSFGKSEKEYMKSTYHTTIHFAYRIAVFNPNSVFTYVSGSHTDSTEKSKIMWARVKGKTENSLLKLPFKAVYNFRPGFIKPVSGQQNVSFAYKLFSTIFPLIAPGKSLKLNKIASVMVNVVEEGYTKHNLEISDIKKLAS